MSKIYKIGNPNHQKKHTLSGQDRLPENDLVYLISDTVNELDISAITAKCEQEQRGFPPYPARMMVALLLYSYYRGLFGLDIPADREIRPLTWEAAARKCIEVIGR